LTLQFSGLPAAPENRMMIWSISGLIGYGKPLGTRFLKNVKKRFITDYFRK
jgi:hypothetical protein